MALYVYGIMRAGDARRAVAAVHEAQSRPLDAVEASGICALVSPTPEAEPRLRRENVLAHSDVLQAAFEHGPVLPFRFGTVVTDAETAVREIISPDAERLGQRLDALDGRGEMQVKATYAEESLLRSILSEDPGLTRLVSRTQSLPAAATHFERIRIGEAIAAAVQSRRAVDQDALMRPLLPLSIAHVASSPQGERGVLNAAFLVDLGGLGEFDEAVEDLARKHGAEIEFKLIGPLPAYSFADRDWQPVARARVEAGWA
ncbi:MAG TPA: GvpL/GvpF family gas vesicle protein [Solirubrobacteraceae bacterium]|nr:GvpL/GvpF family gas vesicle protein [Solirubrobacteraceae bacterium]